MHDADETLEGVMLQTRQDTEEMFEVDSRYIAEQARETLRIFFLPLTSILEAAKSKAAAVRRELRRVGRA